MLNSYKNKPWFQFTLILVCFKLFHSLFLFFSYAALKPGGAYINYTLFQSPFSYDSIIGGAFLHPFILPVVLLVYAAQYFPRTGEKMHFYSTAEKLMACVPVWLLLWELVGSDYNYYLDSAFYFDRVLLLTTGILVWWFPALVPLFIVFALIFRAQFNYPIGGFNLADKRILFDVLILFTSVQVVKKYIRLPVYTFIFLVFCITGSYYMVSGIHKIIISPHGYEWITENKLSDFFFNAYARGWMFPLPEPVLTSTYHFLESYGAGLKIIVLLVELSGLLLLWKRRVSIMLLMLFILLHVGIFIGGSMIFWKWIAVDLLLIFILIKYRKQTEIIFTNSILKYAVIIILTSIVWLRPAAIGWNDTPLNQFFTYEIVDENNQTFDFPKNSFDPYDSFFQTDAFYYLVKQKLVNVSGFGYTGHYKLAKLLRNSKPAGLKTLEKQYGKTRYSKKQRNGFIQFIKIFFHNKNKRLGKNMPFKILHAPYHLNNGVNGNPFTGNSKVKKVLVYFNQTWHNQGKILRLKKELCEEIDIPG